MLKYLSLAALAAAPAFAQLSTFRATIPGSLHQCEATNIFFFDTGASRPLSIVFLPQSAVPASLMTGTTTIEEVLSYSPLLAIGGIETADAAEYDYTLQIAEGEVFEVFGFLPDGTGINLDLPRTVTTPLPGATNCLVSIPTTVAGFTAAGAAAATATATSAATASVTKATTTATRAATTASATATLSTLTSISLPSSGSSTSSAAASTTSAHSDASGIKAGMVLGFGAVVGAAAVLFM